MADTNYIPTPSEVQLEIAILDGDEDRLRETLELESEIDPFTSAQLKRALLQSIDTNWDEGAEILLRFYAPVDPEVMQHVIAKNDQNLSLKFMHMGTLTTTDYQALLPAFCAADQGLAIQQILKTKPSSEILATALQGAVSAQRTNVVETLIRHHAPVSDQVLLQSLEQTTAAIAMMLVKTREFGVEIRSNALSLACSRALLPVVERLLEQGTDVNDATGGKSNIALAAANGDADVIKLLIKNGAMVNDSSDLMLASPLQIAAAHGHTKAVATLLKAGAHINAHSKELGSALYAAKSAEHTGMVKQLEARGAIAISPND